ncbi:T9SS C-terminal target domain-containing protein [Paludibacter sp. 221]|uniref:PKD domain-containing protein n=1 Tax=Paludibacter sp. 221 TaxID=2302939 RepID=UPI0013D443CF|nr:glycosyl hydrolase [Paludibacter sp. 221]NDV46807.1 T9SS C-terminal target domain-containing protein [Paludibacter sp. 221]
MKKYIIISFLFCFTANIFSQQIVQAGEGSYAEYPPESVAYEDGYFAAPYNWFEQAWPHLNLHDNARNKPIPTNDWWTEFLFRGLGRIQPEYHVPPVTVTTDGDRFGCEAWAYPHMVTASANGFNMFFPKGFNGGGMNRGNPLKINATTVLQANDDNVLYADFETSGWPQGWTVSNNTENIPGPMATWEITQSPTPNGYIGDRFINTFKGDNARLTLVSPKFTIEKNYIRLYVGGGNYPDDTYVGLFVDGQRVKFSTGESSGTLKQHTWDVQEYKGKEAEIRIVDNSGGGWGFIMCDEIVFTNSALGGSGYTPDFHTESAKVYDWDDLGFTLRSEDGEKRMDATIVHGVPFVYVELNKLYPILAPDGRALVYDADGNSITDFPVQKNTVALESNGRVYGVHLPAGSIIHQSNGGDFQVEMAGDKRYVVVSALPDKSFLGLYDQYARNKPENITFNYEYKVAEGKVVTSFDVKAVNMDTKKDGQEILMSFLPHHYRTTTKNFEFIPDADYHMFRGKMHTGAAKSFTFSYDFGGMPPYLPEPLDISDERKETLSSLLDYASKNYTINGNTYAKGLGENSSLMLMAKSLDHNGFDLFKNNLKNEFADWYIFDESEKTKKERFFAAYPKYGGVIGFPPGYGSQGFNDLHFHNGYFTIGSARLMMVDKEFKRDFAEMAKLVTQTYANWDRYENAGDTYIPFLRTFDPYFGHSFAGGTGDGSGNNQESTSEAINSWFGIYMLGVELNDKRIIDTGAMGYLLEVTSAGEYWLDLYEENFPETYEHEYVGILRTDNLAWATYFAGDPAWVLGIQACPVDFFFTDFGLKPERMNAINKAMFHERTTFFYDGKPMHTNDDPYDNIKTMGPYLGGYHLNIMNYIDPVNASEWVDDFCKLEGKDGEEWRNHKNTATNYYLSNAMITYGKPAVGYHTSIPSGAVYQNAKGELTYLLYNSTNADVDVDIYKDGTVIETIRVSAGKYYNSRVVGGQNPSVSIATYQDGDKIALNKPIKIQASASDKDGSVLWVDFYFGNEQIGTSYVEPYEVSFTPNTPGVKELKVIATDNDGNKSEPYIINVEVLATAQTPFNDTPWSVPQDKILAVKFDNGGYGISCYDQEIEMQGGNNFRPGTGVETEDSNNGDGNVGWTNNGEWLEYTIEVQETGVYAMYGRLASANGGTLQIDIDGEDKSGGIVLNSTGSWGDYKDVFLANIPLKAGVQIMRITVAKNGANLSSYSFSLLPDEKLPSEVSAGADQVIQSPQNSATLSATVKTYGDAVITKYEWKQVDSNPLITIESPAAATTTVSGLQLGTYVFEVEITDSNGFETTDRVVLVVKPGNFAPIANPGASRTISSSEKEIVLDGSASTDPDGTIVKYEWQQIDANNKLTVQQESTANPTVKVSGFETGNLYIFQLTVTDNEGAKSSENVRIYVDNTTGNNDLKNGSIMVYPNPFSDWVSVSLDESGAYEKVRLYSLAGVLMMEENVRDLPQVRLNTSSLDKGCYILNIIGADNRSVSFKILK